MAACQAATPWRAMKACTAWRLASSGGQVSGSSRGHPAVGRVVGQGLAEVVEVAVQVHVLLRHAAPVREAPGVERVDVEHRHAGGAGLGAPFGVMQREHLHAAAAVALHAVAGAADDQQAFAAGLAVERHVHRELLAVLAGQRVVEGLDARRRRRPLRGT
jgi:hypothetical protein